MTISRLQVTIEPHHIRDSMKELRVEVVVDGKTHGSVIHFEENDFESLFDQMMDGARREILRLVK